MKPAVQEHYIMKYLVSSLWSVQFCLKEKSQSIFLDFSFSIRCTSQVQPHKCAVDLPKILTLISVILPLSTLQHLYSFYSFSPTLPCLPEQYTINHSTSSFVPFIQLFTLLFQYIPYIPQSQPTFLSHIYISTNTFCSKCLTQIIFLPVSFDISWKKIRVAEWPKAKQWRRKVRTQSGRPEERMQNRNVIRDIQRAKWEALECAKICHYA
jgi:hypothetical protein